MTAVWLIHTVLLKSICNVEPSKSFWPEEFYFFDSITSLFLHDKCDFKMVKVIAATVASDPEKYSEAFLGKSNQEYCTWILNPEKWGG